MTEIVLKLSALVLLIAGQLIMVYRFELEPLMVFAIAVWTIIYGGLLAGSEHYSSKRKYGNWRG